METTVSLRWPILTLHTSSYLYLPHLADNWLNPENIETCGKVVGGSTKFSVSSREIDINNWQSIIYKWPLSDLPQSTLCPSLSLSFTTLQSQIHNLPKIKNWKDINLVKWRNRFYFSWFEHLMSRVKKLRLGPLFSVTRAGVRAEQGIIFVPADWVEYNLSMD